MKLIVNLVLAGVLVSAFVFAANFEQKLSGDLEWAICFGIVFVASFLGYLLAQTPRIILAIAALAPLSTLGMFFLVNMLLSAITSVAGIGLAAFFRRVRNRWSTSSSARDEGAEPQR